MKRTLIWFAKAVISGLIALAIATSFCFFYYNLPAHQVGSSAATDHVWTRNHISIRGTEGFAYTKTDEFGFINTYPERKDKVDILIMGSSHTEAFNVNSDKNYTYLLNQKLDENGHNKYAYSIAVSAHDFIRCLKNLESAVKEYNPTDYVVIETNSITFDFERLEQLNTGTMPSLQSHNTGLVSQLQKIDFFRLSYAQISSFIKKDSVSEKQETPDKPAIKTYRQQLETAIQRVSKIEEENGCEIIIVYCPMIKIDYHGKVIENTYTPEQEIFKSVCEKYNVRLIDMHTDFENTYYETDYLPHGFSNTAIGEGHTNKYGHSAIAERLYSTVIEG